MIYIGQLTLKKGLCNIYLSKEKRNNNLNNAFYLTSGDLDNKWIKDIEKNKIHKSNDLFEADEVNRKYIMLYIVFSLYKRILFDDLIKIYGIDKIYNLSFEVNDFQRYCYKDLCEFLEKNNYTKKIIKSNSKYYTERSKFMFKDYKLIDFISFSGFKMLQIRIIRSFQRRFVYISQKLSIFFSKRIKQKKLMHEYDEISRIYPKSASGCLFYKGKNNNTENFIKCNTLFAANLNTEINALRKIKEKSKCPNNYLLPIKIDENNNYIAYPFINRHITLKKYILENKLTNKDVKILIKFLYETLLDLKNIGVIHRDIHMDNILVILDDDSEIKCFKLIDFGCACLDLSKGKITVYDKIQNVYAGGDFRYSRIEWNDSSSILMILQLANTNCYVDKKWLNKFIDLLSENYSIHI